MSELSGNFEIHITVNPENNYFPLLEFCKAYKCKPVYAVATRGDMPNQYMISKWTKICSGTKAVEQAKQLAAIMKDIYSINVVRTKVEAMACNEGVPKVSEHYELCASKLTTEYYNNNPPYFEFHFKISPGDNATYKDLELDCRKCSAALSINIMGKEKIPLITMRFYAIGYKEALAKVEIVKNTLELYGHKVHDGMQQEFSIYDDNAKIDDGWIINSFY